MDTWGGVGPAVQAGGDLAAFPVAEELFPLGVGRHAILLAWALASSACEERDARLDRLVGVDGLVSHGDVDVGVPDVHARGRRRFTNASDLRIVGPAGGYKQTGADVFNNAAAWLERYPDIRASEIKAIQTRTALAFPDALISDPSLCVTLVKRLAVVA